MGLISLRFHTLQKCEKMYQFRNFVWVGPVTFIWACHSIPDHQSKEKLNDLKLPVVKKYDVLKCKKL